jgi:predicted negative regulator of RcsB-dependent stress response
MDSDAAQLPMFDRLEIWFGKNRKQALTGATIVIAMGLIVGFYLWYKQEKEANASEALTSVSLPVGPGTHTDNADAYLKVAANYPNSSAAARAVLLAGGTFFVDGKYDQAKAQFEKFVREYRDATFMGEALLGIAACNDAQGKTDDAIRAYKDLADHHSGDPAVPQAKFALGRLYEAQGKPELARTYFEDVARAEPYGSIGSEAGMRLEELKLKHPELFAAAASPAAEMPQNLPQIILPPATNAAGTNAGPTTKAAGTNLVPFKLQSR